DRGPAVAIQLTTPDWQTVRVPVDQPRDGHVLVEMEVAYTFVPSDRPPSRDQRRLGVLVREVGWREGERWRPPSGPDGRHAVTSRLDAGWRYTLGAILQKSLYLKRYGGRTRRASQREGSVMDGLPIPPPPLIFASCGDPRPAVYLDGGRAVAETIRALLKRNGIAIEDFLTILEFGSGCGRIMRQWESLSERARLYGTDCNAAAVE